MPTEPLETPAQRAAYLAWDALLPSSFKRALLVVESIIRLPGVLAGVIRDVAELQDSVSDLRKKLDQ